MVLGGSSWTNDRIRHLLDEFFPVALAVCLLAAAVGGFFAVDTFTGPDTRTEQRVVGTWSSDANFSHQATVRRDTTAFERGRVLRNRSLYFSRVSPVLDGTYVYRHEGDVDPASVTVELHLVIRSVGQTERGSVTYWRVSDPITSEETTLAPGETVRIPFSINTTEQFNRTANIRRELDTGVGEPQVFVVAETHAETTLVGEEVTDARTDRLAIEPRSGTYAVAANASGTYSEEATEAVSVPVGRDPLPGLGGVVLTLAGLTAAAALVVADRKGRFDLSPAERERLRLRGERDEFDEWISVGRVPEPGADERVVLVDSLEGLVDVAIDSGRRVIETTGTYVVLDDRTRYVFEGDSSGAIDKTASFDSTSEQPSDTDSVSED